MKSGYRLVVALLALAVLTGAAQAEVRLATLFSSHMVLQREMALPVWGWAAPGEAVTVTIAGQTLAAVAGQDGRWQVKLAALHADRKPLELTARALSGHVTISDLLAGDVWLCAGQSNMEFGMDKADNAKEALATATNALLRLLSIKAPQAGSPAADLPLRWIVCASNTVSTFTAVGYFFGRAIQEKTGVPIGLINVSWGGTVIESWMPAEAAAAYPELEGIAQAFDKKLAEYNDLLGQTIEPVGQWVESARQAKARNEPLPPLPAMPVHPAVGGLSGIYNGRVAPLIAFGIKGVIWYQGESNGSDDEGVYAAKMRALIGAWRRAWHLGDFPFYFVQLAGFRAPDMNPAGSLGWARIRMAQLRSLQIPRTGMASAVDVGVANDVHPTNKEDVGNRLSLWALKCDYGQSNLVCSGPLYKGMTVEGSKIRITFDAAEHGLMVGRKAGHGPALEATGEPLKRFAVAGSSNAWVWAEAVIDGATVLVSSPRVPTPVAVRYAYTQNPEGCNLYNKDGLPASPFRTDAW